jgi:hypothetical protein
MELRPLTLILGRNNSGKSALIRLALRAAARKSQRDTQQPGQLGGHPLPLTFDGVYALLGPFQRAA